jgi:cobalt-zinc-cadmium efflux system membrane fusion protein
MLKKKSPFTNKLNNGLRLALGLLLISRVLSLPPQSVANPSSASSYKKSATFLPFTAPVTKKEPVNTIKAAQARANQPVYVKIDAAQAREISLKLAPATMGDVYQSVESPGQVQPNAEMSALVSTPSPGRAVKVISRLGQTVKEGELMAVIKSDPIGQVQSDLLQNVLQAKSDIRQQEVILKLDHITYDRESILFKEHVSAKADLQTAENALEKDEALLMSLKSKKEAYIKVAQERLNLLGAPPDSAAKVIAQSKIDPWVLIRAPRTGLVIERTINPGEMNDGSKQLFTLSNLSEVWLVANIYEQDVEKMRIGLRATVTVDSLPDHEFPARIVWVGDSVNATTRTLPVRANVANPDLLLKPNMFARIKIATGKVSALHVPSKAVIQKGDRDIVFVQKGDLNFEMRDVRTGTDDSKNVEILSGLKPGEMVAQQGATALLGAAMKTSEGKQ